LDPSIDGNNVTKENLEKVVKAGEKLLEETVKVMDVTTFIPQEKPSEGTNAQALERFVYTSFINIFFSSKNVNIFYTS